MSAETNTNNRDGGTQQASAAKCPFSRLFGKTPASLAESLREQTKEAHASAEKHAVQARLVKGEATRADYAAWLGQMLFVWRAIDAAIAALATQDARVAAMVKPYHPHAARVGADLAFLGHTSGEMPATRAATEFSAWLASPSVDAIGAWYVMEGSSNGGRFIAKALARALHLTGPDGLTSMDPHGEQQQRERWAAWKADLDRQAWSEAERVAIVSAAERTFNAVREIMEQMEADAPEVAVVRPHAAGVPN